MIPDTLVNFFGENRIPVMDQEAIGVIGRNRFAQLLQRPLSRGMRRDIMPCCEPLRRAAWRSVT
jgi:hypothetical protein